MLIELVAQGLGVIDRAELELDRGCSVITGETGAGKTLIVAALGLLVGGRSERTLVREGAAEGLVEGRFRVPSAHPAVAGLAERGLLQEIVAEEGRVEVVLTRSVGAEGRGKARVNGRMVPLGALTELGRDLVDIAGQNDHGRLSSAASQREALDSFGGEEARRLATSVAAEVRAAASAAEAADHLADEERARSRELDVLRYEIAEIEGAGIAVGEAASLEERAGRLEHAESLAAGLGAAVEALTGEGGAEDALASARSAIASLVTMDPALAGRLERLDAATIDVTDIAQELSGRMVEPDPGALQAVRERLDVLGKILRKYGEDEASVLDYLDRSRRRLADLEATGADLGHLRAEAARRGERALEAAAELGRLRAAAAPRLASALEELLHDLALPGARVSIELEPRPLYEGGGESVRFMLAANAGESVRPLAKIASGGELSRIALALHLLTSSTSAATMVFDEVDAGVGGEAAQAVGRCLAQLARRTGSQVLVVTHLPQVAAFADAHYRVTKSDEQGRASARVERIDGGERVGELSRMLAGLPRSERAREHAEELLEVASSLVGSM